MPELPPSDPSDVVEPTAADQVEKINQRVSSVERIPLAPRTPDEFVLTAPFGVEVTTGSVSTVYPALKPFRVISGVVFVETAPSDNLSFEVRRNFEQLPTRALLTVPSGFTRSPVVNIDTVFGAMGVDLLDIECIFDAGGGFGRFTVALLASRT